MAAKLSDDSDDAMTVTVFRYHRIIAAIAAIAIIAAIATIASCAGYRVDSEPGAFKPFGTSGKRQHVLQKGVEAELFRYEGRGTLTHMWFGGGFKTLGQTRLRIYIDEEATASIDMQLYLGHGIGFNDPGAPWGTERIEFSAIKAVSTTRIVCRSAAAFALQPRSRMRRPPKSPRSGGSSAAPRIYPWRSPGCVCLLMHG